MFAGASVGVGAVGDGAIGDGAIGDGAIGTGAIGACLNGFVHQSAHAPPSEEAACMLKRS